MTYLDRPVFEFVANWKDVPVETLSFDLRAMAVGFGAEYFNQLQSYVARGWSFQLTLATAGELQAFDGFVEALTGNLKGFWIPDHSEALEIVAANSSTVFDITDQDLRSVWNNGRVDMHLWFTRDGESPRAAKITNVVSIGGGKERVTVDTADPAPATTDNVRRLLYVRLAGDAEQGNFLAEGGVQQREVRVVELPNEYTTYETGELPIFLYHFWCEAPIDHHWRYTSFAANVVSGNELFTTFPMSHGALKDSVKPENAGVDLTAKFDANHPLALFLPVPLSRPMFLEIIRVAFADVETQTVVFSGSVRNVSDAGDKISARCDSWLAVLSRKLPRLTIQPECNYNVFDPRTCKLLRGLFEVLCTVDAADPDAAPPSLTLNFTNPTSSRMADWTSEDWFAEGFIEIGSGLSFKTRTILNSVATDDDPKKLVLTLNLPLDLAAGEYVTIVPGCDGLHSTCTDKFDNFDNFGGFLAVPERNPSLKAIDANVSQGGKGK